MKLYTLAETTSRRTENNAPKLTTHDAGHDYSPALTLAIHDAGHGYSSVTKGLAVCHANPP